MNSSLYLNKAINKHTKKGLITETVQSYVGETKNIKFDSHNLM